MRHKGPASASTLPGGGPPGLEADMSDRTCTVEGCTRPRDSRQWCAAHLQRWRAFGDPLGGTGVVKQIDWPSCLVDNCGRPARTAKGVVCKMHGQRLHRQGEAAPKRDEPVCVADGCGRAQRTKQLCGKHYQRLQKHGDPNTPPKWVKGQRLSKNYVYVFVEDGSGRRKQKFEHRIVMEQIIGRPLRAKENVHHRNGDRHDNRPENLELWSSQQPFGQRVEDKVEFAVELLKLYAPHLLA